MKIKKNDTVKIISGKDVGKKGKVVRVFPLRGKVSIEGINTYKKHVKPKTQNEKGQTIEVIRPMHISNVQVICPSCNKTVRTIVKMKNGKRTRFCKKCDSVI